MRDRKIERRIANMKEVILDIHRSAGELDTIVQRMENAMKMIDQNDKEHFSKLIEVELRHRNEMKTILGFDILNEKEEFAWMKLIEVAQEV